MENYILSNGVKIELSSGVVTPVNKSIADIRNPEGRKMNHSKEIEIQGNADNMAFFRGTFSLSSTDGVMDFDTTARVPAILYKGGIPIMQNSVMKLNSVSKQNGNYIFSVNLFSEVTNIFLGLEKAQMSEIDLSEFDHTLNKTSIRNTWTATPNYAYPLIDRGDRVVIDTFRTSDLYPYVSVKYLIKKILGSGTIFDLDTKVETLLNKAMFGFGGGDRLGLSLAEVAQRNAKSKFDVKFNYSGSFFYATVYDLMQSSSITNNFAIANDHLNQINTTQFTTVVGLQGNYKIKCDYNVTMGAPQSNFRLDFWVDGVIILGAIMSNSSSGTFSTNLDLNSGAIVTLIVTGEDSITPTTIDLTGTTLELIASDLAVLDGVTVSVAEALPQMTQRDFLKGIITWLNLYVSEPNIDGNITIYSQGKYYKGANDYDDYTQIVDHSELVKSTPLASEYGKDIKFKFKESKDFDAVTYFNKWGSQYGDLEFQNPSYFSVGEQKFELPFSTIVPYEGIIGSTATFPRFIQVDSNGAVKPNKGNPRIVLWNGLKTGSWKFANSSGATVTTETTYPCIHHFDNITAPTVDTNFQLPREVFYNTSAFTLSNAYKLCYEVFINELINRRAMLIELNVNYNNLDVKNIDFRKLKMIDNALFKLNKLMDFDEEANQTTKIELIKVLDGSNVSSIPNITPVIFTPEVFNPTPTWVGDLVNGEITIANGTIYIEGKDIRLIFPTAFEELVLHTASTIQVGGVLGTFSGNPITVDFGDGTVQNIASGSNSTHLYATPFSGNVRISTLLGLGDIKNITAYSDSLYWDFDIAELAKLKNANTIVFQGKKMDLSYSTAVWNKVPETNLSLRGYDVKLTSAEVDQILIDIDDSVDIGTGTIDLSTNEDNTPTSALAVASLMAKGYTLILNS